MKNATNQPKYNVEPLKLARLKRRWSLAKLASEVDLSEAQVRLIENGKRNPSEKALFRMSEVLEVPIEELLLPVIPKERAS